MNKITKIVSLIGAVLICCTHIFAAVLRNGFLGYDYIVTILILIALFAIITYILQVYLKSIFPVIIFTIVLIISVVMNLADWESYLLVIIPLILFNALPLNIAYLKFRRN